MNNRRSSLYVHSVNIHFNDDLPEFPTGSAFMINRGAIILSDPQQIGGDRYIKGFNLHADFTEPLIDEQRFLLQFAIVPDGSKFGMIGYNDLNFSGFPISNDTIYATTLHDAFENGVSVQGISKPVPRNYYLLCFIWEVYTDSETAFTDFRAQSVSLTGSINISF